MLGKVTLAATVAGALLIAGAGTGATLATWHAQTQVVLGTVRSGSIALTVNGASSATLGALGAMKPGDSRTVTATLTNAAPAGAKNLRMGVYVDSASTGTPAIDAALHVVQAATGACSATGQGVALNGYKGDQLSQSLAPQQSVTFCMTLLLPGNAAVPPTGLSAASLQLSFRGQYDAWTATAAATSGVTLLPAPPAAPPPPSSFKCVDTGSAVTLSWDAVTGAAGYDVLLGSAVITTTGTSVTVNANQVPAGNDKYTMQVRATNAGGTAPAAPGSTVQVHVKNNGTVACQ